MIIKYNLHLINNNKSLKLLIDFIYETMHCIIKVLSFLRKPIKYDKLYLFFDY